MDAKQLGQLSSDEQLNQLLVRLDFCSSHLRVFAISSFKSHISGSFQREKVLIVEHLSIFKAYLYRTVF